jgi:hypothetical protein
VRVLVPLALLILAAPAAGASLPMANGYGALGAPRYIEPVALGQLFCHARIAGDMSALEKFYAPKLARLLTDVPPSAVPWQTYPDQPQSCTVGIVNGFDDTIGVIVAVNYTAATRSWVDQLNLQRTPDSWLLNNVFYEGGGNLRFRLVNAAP